MSEISEAGFQDPPSEYRLSPFWFLNHELNAEETVWQVREMHSKGVDGFVLHPRHGLITPYLSEEFLDQIQAAVEEGERLGMKAYLYDENNWPSGAADGKVVQGHPEFRMSQVLLNEQFEVGAGGVEKTLAADPLAVVAVSEGKDGFPQTSRKLDPFVNGKELRWKPEGGKWRVYVFTRRYLASHFSGWVPDLMNQRAMERFIELTHRKYAERLGAHFGRTILGIFTDEPAMNFGPDDGAPWTDGIAEAFNWRHGYDLVGALPALFLDMGEETTKIRCDFYDTATELYVDAFFKQIYDYCDKLRLATMGHVLCEGEFPDHVRMQGDFFRGAKYMHYGGVDQLCEMTWGPAKEGWILNNVLAPKFASSAAHLLEKPLVMSECFGLAGQWGVSLRTLKWLADWNVLMGVNLLEPHAFYYSIQGFRKWECPPGEFYQAPFWPYYRQFADYCARLCYLFRGGRHVADAALLYPVRGMWAALSPGRSEATDAIVESLNQVSRGMLRANYDYDILPEEALEKADFSAGTIVARNEAGKELEEYRVLVLPEVSVLMPGTVVLIRKYLEGGGKVLVAGGLPKRLWGEEKQASSVAALSQALEQAKGQVAFLNPKSSWDLEAWEQHIRESLKSLIEPEVKIEEGETPIGDITHLHHEREGRHFFLFVNTSRSVSHRTQVSVAARGNPRVWDALSGQVRPLERFETADDRTVLHLDFAPQESFVVSLEAERPGKPALGFEGDVELVEAVTLESVHVATRQQGMIQGVLHRGKERKPVSARQPAAPLKPLTLSRRWEFQTDKPNAFPLVQWGLQMEAAVRGRDSASGWNSYSCRFNCATKPKQARLLVDGLVVEKVWGRTRAVDAKFELNGEKITAFEKGQYLDHFIREADISGSLKRGQNVLAVRTEGHCYEIPSLVHPPIVVGDFSVDKVDDGWALRSPKTTIVAGDWSEQGYPFYSGIGAYSQQVEIPASFIGKRLVLELEAVGDLAEVVINGKRVAVLAWDPFEVDVTNYLRRGKNAIVLKVANSMQNLLCRQPKPSGILGDVRIVPYTRVTLK